MTDPYTWNAFDGRQAFAPAQPATPGAVRGGKAASEP